MERLDFESISKNMQVLYKIGKEVYATTVVETSNGHPSIPTIRLVGGFIIRYSDPFRCIYADNAINRTELLLNNETVFTNLNKE